MRQPIEIVTRHYAERIHFDIVKLATQDIYLGMPWLKKHNPVVNWRTGVLTFLFYFILFDSYTDSSFTAMQIF